MAAYRTLIFAEEGKEQRKQDKLATRIHKSLAGQLKPSDAEIIERLKVKSHEFIQRI